jgi:S-adenosylmethionine:tRNA ribosyltransferase-isomerase
VACCLRRNADDKKRSSAPHSQCLDTKAIVLVSEFDYYLPEELIAQQPLPDRSASRMLVVYRNEQRWEDRKFSEFPQFIRPGDCLIVNNSKVFPSRLYGRREFGTARVEVFLLKPQPNDPRTWEALVRPGRKIRTGERIFFADGFAGKVIGRGEYGWRLIHFEGEVDVLAELEKLGHVPLPPYIRREDTAEDRSRYQTVYAQEPGSIAAPTAGLHFTPAILDACRAAGSSVAEVTLHVGLGTFAPVHAGNVEDVALHAEVFHISAGTMQTIRAATRRIAVGTTSVRAVESGSLDGETTLFIHPGYAFRNVDMLLTNFHLPKSSLLMLVSAFGGMELIRAAYEYAVRERYRFFSYGDCMLIADRSHDNRSGRGRG